MIEEDIKRAIGRVVRLLDPYFFNRYQNIGLKADRALYINGQFIIGTPRAARIYRSTNQTIATGTWTAISFDAERFDTDNIWVVGSPTRLTCQTAGLYLIIGHLTYVGNTTGRRICEIRLNGTTTIGRDDDHPTIVQYLTIIATTLYQMGVGDYVEMRTYQDSGGDLDVVTVAQYSPEFMMVRVG